MGDAPKGVPARLVAARWWLEGAVLLVGALWGLGALVEGAYNPAAELTLRTVRHTNGGQDDLVVSGSFKVTRGRIRIEAPVLKMADLDVASGVYQPKECGQLADLARQAHRVLPEGDALEFACRVRVPTHACIGLRIELEGKRAVGAPLRFLWSDSSWTSSTIDCDGAP